MFIKSALSSNNTCQDPGWVLQSMRLIEGKSAWNHINWINYLFFFLILFSFATNQPHKNGRKRDYACSVANPFYNGLNSKA